MFIPDVRENWIPDTPYNLVTHITTLGTYSVFCAYFRNVSAGD